MDRYVDTEEWRDVPGYPTMMASSWGRIKPKPRTAKMPHGGVRKYEPMGTYGAIRQAKKTASHTYRGAHYRGIGNVKVHRLVCAAFHGPAPFEGAVVIHINENAHDNRPENLKWGTQKENLNAPGFIALCRARKDSRGKFMPAKITRAE